MALNQTQLLLLQQILRDLNSNLNRRDAKNFRMRQFIRRKQQAVARQLEETMES